MKYYFLVIISFLVLWSANAQRFSIKSYGIADGLLQSEVGQPKVLYDGMVVIPQLTGQLQKFDGYKFEILPNVNMSGCCSGGFINFNNFTFLRDGEVNQIYSRGVFTVLDNKYSPPVSDLLQQQHVYYANDTLWSYGNETLYYFDFSKMMFLKSKRQYDLNQLPENYQKYKYLKESKNGKIIFGYNNLTGYDKTNNSIYRHIQNKISGIAKNHFTWTDEITALATIYNFSDAESKTNILTLNRGEFPSIICEYNFDTLFLLGITPSKGGAAKVNDQLYLQGGHQGLFRINPNIHYLPSTDPNMVKSLHSIFEFDNKIWFGGYGYGFATYENYRVKKQAKHTNFSVMPGSVTHPDKNVYFMVDSKEAALYAYQHKSNNRTELKKILPETGYILKSLQNNGLAMGSNDHRIYLWPNIAEPHQYKILNKEKGNQNSITLAIEQDKNGKLWLLGKGLGIYDPHTDTIYFFENKVQDPNPIGGYCMVMDSFGTLWFGTKNGVYYLLNATNIDIKNKNLKSSIKKINLPNGKNDVIMSAIQVDNYIVTGSGTSISFIDLTSFYQNPKNPIIYQLIYGEDIEGGGSEQNCIFFDSKRKLWIGAQEGAVMIDWDKFKFDKTKNKIKVHLLQTGNDTIIFTSKNTVELAPDKRNLKIEFGLDKNPSLLKNVFFDYTLISEDADTLENIKYDQNGNLDIKYLPPGAYTLRIIAKKHGQNMDELTIHIVANRSLSESPIFWLGLSCFILFTSLAFLWYRHRARNEVFEKEIRLSQLTSEKDHLKIQAIISSFNPHFINNSLHWIQSRHMDDNDTVNLVGDLSENIRYIFDTTKTGRATHTFKNEMQLVNNYVNVQLLRFANSFTFIQPSNEELHKYASFELIVMQLQIHIENAIEHGLRNRKQSSFVKLSIEENANEINFKIEDDGGGRNYAKKIKSTGTQRGSQMLRELHEIFNEVNKNKISTVYDDDIYQSEGLNFGTRVTITIPKNYKYQIKDSK